MSKASKQELQKRLSVLQADLKSGKISGPTKTKVAKRKINGLKWRLRHYGRPTIKVIKSKRAFNPAQGNLPGFLQQLDLVRIEELVAQRLFESMKKQIGLSDKKEQIEITFASDKKKRAV